MWRFKDKRVILAFILIFSITITVIAVFYANQANSECVASACTTSQIGPCITNCDGPKDYSKAVGIFQYAILGWTTLFCYGLYLLLHSHQK